MYRTLFYIPHDFLGIPLFGFGWMLLLLVGYAILSTVMSLRNPKSDNGEIGSNLAMCAVGAAVIVFVIPGVEIRRFDGEPIGMAIRGYGFMMLTGVVGAVALAVWRARRHGISAETMIAAAPWLFILGILGARIFYVIEYRERFAADSIVDLLRVVIDFTKGGIVVYGSLIGGFIGLVVYCRRYGLPFFRMADIIIPCIFIGLFFGRIGCIMNGCCYGGRCEPSSTAFYFPKGSPVFEDQIRSGEILGLTIEKDSSNLPNITSGIVEAVAPDSLADEVGITEGQQIQIFPVAPPEDEVKELPVDDISQLGVIAKVDDDQFRWSANELPDVALPVAPAQLYSSLTAISVAILLVLITPYVRREGVLLGIGFATYAVVRFCLELIRSDEPGQFGTSLTISQWVSIFVFIASIGLIVFLYRPGNAKPDEAVATNP